MPTLLSLFYFTVGDLGINKGIDKEAPSFHRKLPA